MNSSSGSAGVMAALKPFIVKFEAAILNPLIILLALAAFVVFVWGVVQFIANAADEEKRGEGQRHILWGLVGLVIIFGANAIIHIAASTFGLTVPQQ